MAPGRKRTTTRRKNHTVRNEKLVSFLKDFDSQVRTIVEQLKADQMKLQKEMDGLYNIEILKWPVKMREMNWLECFENGGGQRALEEAAKAKFDIEEINMLTAKVAQTPFKSAKKVRKLRKIGAVDEDIENKVNTDIPSTKSKAKSSVKKLPATVKKLNVLSVVNRSMNKSIFQTPALRTPGIKERVYSFSENGSPLADINNLYVSVPVKGGETVRLLPSEIDNVDVSRLDQETRDNIQLLASRLAKVAGKIKNQR